MTKLYETILIWRWQILAGSQSKLTAVRRADTNEPVLAARAIYMSR